MNPIFTRPDRVFSIGTLVLIAFLSLGAGVLAYPTLAPLPPLIIEPSGIATSTTPTTPKPTSTSKESRFTVYTTAYTWHDNTPPGSAIIAFPKSAGFPTVHNVADGNGTYQDPITLAVGHVIVGGKSTADYKPGTRFYLPDLRRYFIVEDLCGDGDTPQDRPCHKNIDHPGVVQVDLWVDTEGTDSTTATACAHTLTDVHLIIKDPLPNYAVAPGPLFQNGACAERFGDTVRTR